MKTRLFGVALAIGAALAGCGAGNSDVRPTSSPTPTSVSVVIARSNDAQGQPHTLLLEPAPEFQAAFQELLQQNQGFAVISAATQLSNGVVTPVFSPRGDLAVGDWRFALDFAAQAEAAPILIMKAGSEESLQVLAANLPRWWSPGLFNADVPAVQSRLLDIIKTVMVNAADPKLGPMYAPLAAMLSNPNWTGVLILNPVLPGLPAQVLGRPSGLPTGLQLIGHHVGVNANGVGTDRTTDPASVFGLVDYTRPPAPAAPQGQGPLPAGLDSLHALFADSALVLFEAKLD